MMVVAAAAQAAVSAVQHTSCSSRVQTQQNVRGAFTSGRRAPCQSLQIPALRQRQQRCDRLVVCAAAAEVGKLISKVEIPAFIPRTDLMDQLTRWAIIEVQENGVASVGMPCKVTPYRREGALWGFTVSFLKDGVATNDVRVAFDEEPTQKYEWVGRGADGFPALEGNSEEIVGKHFEIRKVDKNPVADSTRTAIKDFCQMLVGAINKYYAFGSVFVSDST